ncbi:LCP family protein [Psychrobacillus lasiicapitis]|uniref:Regulatory protein MsrR n=1 Tax=Psychrobacillus lasiicapitis TaxID=1636719 RepID=A0A544TH48_9BACI|nr:LCP family protein [Psychrobacillus lasiicapitis]TQR16782.1 LytR family transcriptional regulator [Psychrobacillus lasiicapitis]GGA27240.1 LytR family transcriptional regulator [Psychrobacillus lasiicapitis]
MEEERQLRTGRKRKRRLRVGRVFTLFLVLVILISGLYAVTQYSSGYKLANKEVDLTIDFEGDKLQAGERENILVLGVDSRGQKQARSDTMMLVSWDKQDNDVKIVSFMRDIYADIPGYQSYKLNTAYYLDGVQLLKGTIQQMFGLPIHHYALIDFSSFESLVDILAPNGIPVDVEKDMSEKIGVSLTQGQQNLSGKELLGYARFRADENGDFGRVERQQKVMEALKDELLSIGNLSNTPKFLGAAEGYIETDYSRTDKAKRIIDALISGKLEIEKLTIPVEGTYTFSNYKHAGSVLEINTEKNKQAIEDFLEK